VPFAAEVEGSMEMGGRLPQEVVEVPLQEEEEGGRIAPSWMPRWWSLPLAPDSRRGAYRYGWRRRGGGRYMRCSRRPRRRRRRSSILHVVQDHVC